MWWMLISAMIVAMLRFTIHGAPLSWEDSYEAFAHMWVGFMIATAVYSSKLRWFCILVLIILTVQEIVMFYMH